MLYDTKKSIEEKGHCEKKKRAVFLSETARF
jgi:hypothetical protein